MEKTHWKKLANNDYIGAYTLMDGGENKDLIVKIESIARKVVKGEGGKEDECTVAELAGQKPFIINATNAKTLTRLFGSPYIEDWTGKLFTLFVAKVKVAGDTVDALRIRPELPEIKRPELDGKHPRWEGAITALQAGNTTVETIKKSFALTPQAEELLKAYETPKTV